MSGLRQRLYTWLRFTPTDPNPYQQRQFIFLWRTWAAILTIAAVDIIWIALTPWKIHWPWILAHADDLAALGILLAIFHTLRIKPDVLIFLHLVAQCIVLPMSALTLSYLLAGYAFPLQDEAFIAADRVLGFNWLVYIGWLNEHPGLAKLLTYSYMSMIMQVSLIIPLLCFLPRLDQAQRFVAGLVITSLITVVFATLWPAMGGYVHHQVNLADYPNLMPAAAFLHQQPIEALRSGAMQIIGMNMQGIVTFPSFHTTMAVLLTYAAWPILSLRWIFVMLNVLMIISTLGDGGHYLTDVLGGATIAALAILLVRRWLPEPPKTGIAG